MELVKVDLPGDVQPAVHQRCGSELSVLLLLCGLVLISVFA